MSTKLEIFCQKFAHFGRFRGSFLTNKGVKSRFLEFFKDVLVSFGKFLGIVFGHFQKYLKLFVSGNTDPLL